MTDTGPRTAWLHRRVLNVRDLYLWGEAAGIRKMMPADEIHFTQATIRTPVDWDGLRPDGDGLVVPPGPKPVQIFAYTIKALTFVHPAIAERHARLLARYPMIDHPTMRPHVSLYKGGRMPRLAYDGPLELGPEILEEFDATNTVGIKHVLIRDALRA